MPTAQPLFPDLPDEAQLWVYPAASALDADTQSALSTHLRAFITSWTSHDQPVRGAATVLHDRFVVLAGLRADGEVPSGCAIDAATRTVEAVAQELGIDWVPSLHVLYRAADGTVASASRGTFQARAEAGAVTTQTTVFDPSVSTLGALRSGAFERPAAAAWHAQAFSLPEPSAA